MQAIKENKDKKQSENKKRMDIIREKLNNFLRIESKKIRENFYNIEKITNNYIQYKIIHKLKDVMQLVAKKRNIKNYKNKSSNRLYKIFKKQSKNKKRIDDIKDELKNPTYVSKSESKDIKRTLYNIEKRNIVGSKKTKRYLDELDKKILKLDKYHGYDDYEYKGIKDITDLFKLSIDKDHYKATLVKSGYNGNYVQYKSQGDKILTLKKYLVLIEKYLRELIK